MDRTSKVIVRKIILDFTCVFIVGFAVLMFYLFGKPYKRGFFCNDESLMHPYHSSTVTNVMLYIVGIFLPLCVMLLGEFVYAKQRNGQSSVVLFGRAVPPWVVLVYHKAGTFLFGAAITVLTCDIAKYTIGRLRPHFLALCVPNVNCSLPQNQNKYIEKFTCTASNVGPRLLKEVRLSFPSGHAAFSMYAMLFLVFYLQLRFTWKGSNIFKHFLQLICIFLAWATAMSRVSDYKHHWSDVLVGMLIGTTVASINVFGIANLFKDRQQNGANGEMKNGETDNSEKFRPVDYDAETAMQDELSPLRSQESSYGGTEMIFQHIR